MKISESCQQQQRQGNIRMRQYLPFAYPPDFELARTHQGATRPGKIDPATTEQCACCGAWTKEPLQSWFYRSVDHDFKDYGGSVVTYFWLVKLYALVSGLVLLLYSSYLLVVIHKFCGLATEGEGCESFLGIRIITNENLFSIIQRRGEIVPMTRLLTLRSISYVILLLGNFAALYVAGRFKRRYPQPKNISSFALLFKNAEGPPEQLADRLRQEFPGLRIKQVLPIRKMEPFYTLYNNKLEAYYASLVEQDPKLREKMLRQLEKNHEASQKHRESYCTETGRVIMVFHSEAGRSEVKKQYELTRCSKAKYLLGFGFEEERRLYCEACPIPEEIIWNNLGEHEGQKIKLKILSVVYFVLLIAGSVGVLYFCLVLVYNRKVLPAPWNMIAANVIMIALVAVALTFRQWMNRLSEMRKPNTQTHRTMFIIITTVLFHFIYYLIIPSVYLRLSRSEDDPSESNKVLFIITNQTFNFILVQFVLAYIDLMYYCWNKRLKRVQDQERPVGCQKILHARMEYPRFPIEFKLIILFKTFSFIILFAFESPFILFFCFALLVFLYVFDKLSVYRHYRMEIIDNGVQFKFLKIYSTFFSLYATLIYLLTQHLAQNLLEFYGPVGGMLILVFLQLFVIKDRTFEDETILPTTLEDAGITQSYVDRFEAFRRNVMSDKIDMEIRQYLERSSEPTIKTESSINKPILS